MLGAYVIELQIELKKHEGGFFQRCSRYGGFGKEMRLSEEKPNGGKEK